MIRINDLPRDRNGIIQGAWRVLHRNPGYGGQLGPAIFKDGASRYPVAGRAIQTLAATFGKDLYMEPWGDAPRNGFALPPMVKFDLPDSIDWTPEPCPWRKPVAVAAKVDAELERVEEAVVPPTPQADTEPPPSPEPDSVDLDALDKAGLVAFAEANGIDVDGRLGERKLRRAIRRALG